ncbi:MAG: L-seryl-tRNA(Sec) selenium transferase, partial [Longimicrobiales bacterium]
VGGGAYPDAVLDTTLVALTVDDADALHARLRAGEPPVVARTEDGALVIDPRTVAEHEEDPLIAAVRGAVG